MRKLLGACREVTSQCTSGVWVRAGCATEAEVDTIRKQRGQRAELFRDHERRVIREHDAARSDANSSRAARYVCNDYGRGSTRDTGHAVMLGEPEAFVPELLGVLGEPQRIAKCVCGRRALRDGCEI